MKTRKVMKKSKKAVPSTMPMQQGPMMKKGGKAKPCCHGGKVKSKKK